MDLNPTAARAIHSEMIAWRCRLHAHPETGFEEFETSAFIAAQLESFGMEVHREVGRTGVVGVLRGHGGPGRSVGLRADMDALHLQEANEVAYASRVPGKMHACGHDGHVAMLLGAAKLLAANPSFAGTVNFIFQPAEESLGGARVMIEDHLFERFPCDQVFGLHNWPELPLGTIACRPGPVMAASDTISIIVKGTGGHAAMPHLGVDAVLVAAHIIVAAQALVSRTLDPTDAAVLSFPVVKAGVVENVIPGEVQLGGTIRTLRPQTRDAFEEKLRTLVGSVAAGFGASASLDHHRNYPSVINSAAEALIASKAATAVVGLDNVLTEEPPSMGSEDFAYMLQRRPGCYVWLGQGGGRHSVGVHKSNYDFNDDLLPIGADYWCSLVEKVLRCGGRI